MAVLNKIKENFGDVSKGAVAGAMMLGAALTPQFATQAYAGEVKVAAATTPNVVIEYGDQLKSVDIVAENVEEDGIPVELRAGYSKPSCGRVTVNGTSIEFDQHSVDAGKLGSYISRSTQGKKIRARSMPSCELST